MTPSSSSQLCVLSVFENKGTQIVFVNARYGTRTGCVQALLYEAVKDLYADNEEALQRHGPGFEAFLAGMNFENVEAPALRIGGRLYCFAYPENNFPSIHQVKGLFAGE